jgi:hypothetical protein
MKKSILSLICFASFITLSAYGQAPDGVNYQAVVRDNAGLVIASSPVGMQLTLHQTNATGTIVYEETFAPTTSAFGLVNLVLGQGTVVSGDFTVIDWSSGPYFLEISADVTGGTSYSSLGTQQLMSVPYALHAKTSDDSFSGDYNELINQPTIPTNTSQLVNDSGFITSPDDADPDPTNELNTGISLTGTTLIVTDAGGSQSVDLSPLQDGVTDADADPTNEIQTLSISGNQISLSNGGGSVIQQQPVIENTGGRSDICSGNTSPGSGWQSYDATTISITVATAGCSYSAAPRYFTSIGGLGSHFELVGASAIYNPSATFFTIYVKKGDQSGLSVADAVAGGWFINWTAIGE